MRFSILCTPTDSFDKTQMMCSTIQYCCACLHPNTMLMEAGWNTVPCPATNINILICKSSARTKQSVISVALKTPLEIRLGICIYKTSLLHRPDDHIGFTPSCPPTFYNKIAPMLGLTFFQSLSKRQTIGENQNKDQFENWQLYGVECSLYCDHRAIKLTHNCVCFANSMYQSPCSALRHSWILPKVLELTNDGIDSWTQSVAGDLWTSLPTLHRHSGFKLRSIRVSTHRPSPQC